MERFVIIGTGRTGSNLLCNSLDQHRDVICHFEIFHPKACFHKYRVDDVLATVEERNADPEGYLQSLLNYSADKKPGATHFGYKVFFSHSAAPWGTIISREDIKKVIIRRENVLAQYSSAQIAKERGIYAVGRDDKVEDVRITFDPEKFTSYVSRLDKKYEDMKERISRLGQTFYYLEYRDIARNNLDGLYDYLGVEGVLPTLETRLHSPKDMSQRFQNFDEVVKALQGTPHEHWLQEEY